MEKQERRQKYVIKSNHQRKQKQSRKEHSLVSKELIEKMKSFQLKDIIEFMNEDYEKIIKREKDVENQINVNIIKRVEQLKIIWRSFHRKRLIAFLEKHKLPFKDDLSLSLQAIVQPIWKKGSYSWNIQNGKRKNKKPQHISATNIMVIHPVNTTQLFFLQDFDQSIDFHIEFKRMKKDTLYLCTNFLDLVQDVQREFKIKWQK